MKTLKVRKVTCTSIKAREIPALMQAEGIAYNKVEQVNWPEAYPYKPCMEFALAYDDRNILIHYRVTEQSVRAVATGDAQHIWEDSCVEFFSSPADDGLYYNIECNCAGQLLVAVGKDRHQRTAAPAEVLQGIERWASLGRMPFDTKEEETRWELALKIPFSTWFQHAVTSLTGKQIRANFYKCGDLLPVPHFLSWNPIGTEHPDFHQPGFFGTLEFE